MTSQSESQTSLPTGSTSDEAEPEGTIIFALPNPIDIVARLERQDPDLQGNGLANKALKEGLEDPS